MVDALLARVGEAEAAGPSVALADLLAETAAAVKFRDRVVARDLAERATAVATAVGHPAGAAAGRLQRCHCDVYLGRHAEALAAGERAVIEYDQLGDSDGLSRALVALSSVHALRGDARDSLDLALLAVTTAEATLEPVSTGWALNRLGNASALVGDLRGAARAHLRAVALLEAAGDRLGEAIARENLGEDLLDAGDPTAAVGHLDQALVIQLEIAPEASGLARGWRGEAALALGRHGEAIDHLEAGVETARSAGERAFEASLLVALARALRIAGRPSEAAAAASGALAAARGTGGYEPQVEAQTVLGELAFDGGRDRAGEETLRDATRIGIEHGLFGFAAQALDALTLALERRGRYQEALATSRGQRGIERRIVAVGAGGGERESGLSRDVRAVIERRLAATEVVPICSYCHAVRGSSGSWVPIEAVVSTGLDATCTHGICPSCFERVVAESSPAV